MAFRSFFRWQHWRWRSRFWRNRARAAEKALAAEIGRNREREDELLTVSMRVQGLFGVPPRTAPTPAPRQLAVVPDSWEALPYADRAEFEMFWKEDAKANNVPEHIARQKFMAEVVIPRRQPLNDDPYGNN